MDSRSDIYSLGVTLFYMLMGHAPFVGSIAQVMSQHLYEGSAVGGDRGSTRRGAGTAAGDAGEGSERSAADERRSCGNGSPTVGRDWRRRPATRGAQASTGSGRGAEWSLPGRGGGIVGDELLRIEAADRQGGDGGGDSGCRRRRIRSRGCGGGNSAGACESGAGGGAGSAAGRRRRMGAGALVRGAGAISGRDAAGRGAVSGIAGRWRSFVPGLRQLAEAADRLAELDLPMAGFSLHEVRVDRGGERSTICGSIRCGSRGRCVGGTLGTISGGTVLPPMGRRGAVKVVGSLAYEVLGGVRLGDRGEAGCRWPSCRRGRTSPCAEAVWGGAESARIWERDGIRGRAGRGAGGGRWEARTASAPEDAASPAAEPDVAHGRTETEVAGGVGAGQGRRRKWIEVVSVFVGGGCVGGIHADWGHRVDDAGIW